MIKSIRQTGGCISAVAVSYLCASLAFGASLVPGYAAIPLLSCLAVAISLAAGLRTVALCVIVISSIAESLSQLPAGTMMVAGAISGMLIVQSTRWEKLAVVWRGGIVSCLATALWLGLVTAVQTKTTADGFHPASIVPQILGPALLSLFLWLIIATVLLGLRGLFQARTTQPIEFS